MMTVRDLQKRFGDVVAVDHVTFTVPDRSITGLVGANGAGKSTTLGLMAGLLQPDGGSVEVDGQTPREACRRLGALLDHRGLYSRLTARENIAYFGALHGLSGATLRNRVAETVERLDLGRVADRRTHGFSQGERMKVALARALVHGPQHLLLDEVTNGLDVPAVRNLRALLMRLRDEGRCILFSSHVLAQVEALCDRLVVVAAGRVVAEGTVDGIRARAGAATLEEAFVTLARGKEMPACLPA